MQVATELFEWAWLVLKLDVHFTHALDLWCSLKTLASQDLACTVMTTKKFTFKATNDTTQGWDFVLYQQSSKTIAWRVLSLSRPQTSPTCGIIPWTWSYQVTVPQSNDAPNVFIGGITQDAQVGHKYELVEEEGFLQINDLGKEEDGYISFKNSCNKVQNLGLMLDGSLVAMQYQVHGAVTAQFKIIPEYYCGLYTNLAQGDFVPSDSPVKPVQILFPNGMNHASLSAEIKDGQVLLMEPTYTSAAT